MASKLVPPTKFQHTQIDTKKRRTNRCRLEFRLFDKVTWFTALVALIVHLRAELRDANQPFDACALSMAPWLAQNIPCAVFDFNCYRQGTSGNQDDIAAKLQPLDRSSLTKILFSHCPSLSIPNIITQFPELLGLQTLNCTIDEWPLTSAISEASHGQMAEVHFFDTNMSEVPRGLMHGDLPERLSFIVHASNLTLLPEDSGIRWNGHMWPYLSFQHVPLRRLPSSVAQARVAHLTLFNTHIESIDDDAFADFELSTLRLSHNRFLSRLPVDVGKVETLFQFEAEFTNVSDVPAWLRNWYATNANAFADVVVTLHGSPFCESDSPKERSTMCSPRDSVSFGDKRYEAVKTLRPV